MNVAGDLTHVIAGYRAIEQLYSGSRTLVYRAIRETDRHPAVIKVLKREYPSFSELLQFRNQYAIAKNLCLPGVVEAYTLEPYRNSYALVMEDFGGISLKDYAKTRALALDEFLDIAIQITDILNGLYRNRVIHKDLKPANILINPQTKQVKLIDFSISSLLPRETYTTQNPNGLEGTLAYLSPEQTGRMNRGIDYRSDFYSLGITFFELLTGQLPFPSHDPMELVHCHVAKQPPTVCSLNPDIPLVLSNIVSKLMAKNAEDRYQNVLGLKHDLERCLQELQAGQIQLFELGERDICDRFLISEKLYGRQTEVEILLNAFNHVSQGSSEIMLVAGFSGIGKTAVVNEVHKPIVQQRGYFIKGKFDQFNRNIPFAAFVQAFRDLMGQLLSETDEQLERWKAKILSALGENGQVIIQVIPELERIIGQQPPVAEQVGNASQNRFNLLFPKFIQVFTTQDHPLVIFLDDLQWADSASLKLMQLLMSDTHAGYLLLIGAYRDNEVSPAHPLMLTLDEVRSSGAVVNTITLKPLIQNDLNYLVADTLSCSQEIAAPLTELVYQKTQGNPFFATQFLKALHEEGWITFNTEIGYWQCDIAQIRALALTDDVVEFMAHQLQKLPASAQTVLKLAACIGNKFDLATLAIVDEKSQAETASDLWKALQEGLVLPTSEVYKFFQEKSELRGQNPSSSELLDSDSCSYKFLHDRVQQAAYSLIPDEQKQIAHLKIGQLLLTHTSVAEQEEKLFEIVNQLNIGKSLIFDKTQQTELAQLNLKAGQKARAATAYIAAFQYCTTGIDLLPEDGWQTQYETTLALYKSATEAAYLSGNFEQMKQLAASVTEHSKTLLDTIEVYEVQIQAAQAQHQFVEAVRIALKIVERLGTTIPEQPSQSDTALAFETTKSILAGRQPLDLIDLPQITEPNKLAVVRILAAVSSVAFVAAPTLLPFIVLEQVNLSVRYGNSSFSTNGYAYYGLMLCGVIGDVDRGYQFGQLALKLLEYFNTKELKARVYVGVHFSIWHWKEPLRESLPFFREGYQVGLETGDLEAATICAFGYVMHSWFVGKELIELSRESSTFRAQLNQLNQAGLSSHLTIFQQAILNLTEDAAEAWQLTGNAFDRDEMLPKIERAGDRTALSYFYVSQLILYYLFGKVEMAVEAAIAAENYLSSATGLFVVPLFYTYDSLAHLAIYSRVSEVEQQSILQRVAKNQEKMKSWAQLAPANHRHKFYLVEAERYRVLEDKSEALEFYDRAIARSTENEYLQEVALANELAAKFYLEWGKPRVARDYLHDAYYGYARWGATAKVSNLEQSYPELLALILQPDELQLASEITLHATHTLASHTITSKSSTSSNSISAALDLKTVLKASQTLSSEIHLEQLLSTLLQVVIENAGADKCALLLLKENQLVVEAISTVTYCSIMEPIPLEDSLEEIPIAFINSVKHTLQPSVVSNPTAHPFLMADPYVIRQQPKSLMCAPILHQGKLLGILYLENNLTTGVFTSDRVEILNLLCTQAAISLENARLYQRAQDALSNLQQAQLQLVQSEKMSALGNLVAGVAHEINNPVGFIGGNLKPAKDYIKDLFELIDLYQKKLPNPDAEIEEEIEAIDLAYLREDLPKLIDSMKLGVERIRGITSSLRTFSRADRDRKVPFNLHDGIDSTILILKHRLKPSNACPAIEVVKDYGDLPLVDCFAGQLNQVFMNILANAIDALEESNKGRTLEAMKPNPHCISIQTRPTPDNRHVIIRIADNGVGMKENIQQKVFDHLFTTKPVGKGTGLGLAIARQIVEETHGGKLSVNSVLGEGTAFIIEIPV
ncbi:ATP-binding sensor histidine kinase [Coleofasciculus sp. FACHB-1120]|uniref:trifunctional serine/threonine-protein kinase/ATP-binding protein/sensor histidine kinase n=1 Tax=Coleofasciculus sp. FACHB-1120 TaxID=2692783 RepID=UPI00168A0CDA|nr:ATP-binding sensor histidine kinase [Coleofasciculus sp. FACHB-1120]MBD2744551.1 AAA family ATPase [Coleofasciculus sp. FACHB-1120]